VLGRRGEHVPQKRPVALLQLVALAQGRARFDDSRGERVAHPLQLAEVGDSRHSDRRRHPGVDSKPWERLRGELGQLTLHAPDLAPQLRAGEPLVADSERRDDLPCKQILHPSAESSPPFRCALST